MMPPPLEPSEPPPSYEDVLASTWGDASSHHEAAAPSLPPRPRPPSPTSTAPAPPRPVGPLPTVSPANGYPLLYKGKILLYPVSVPTCSKCYETGYVNRNPLKPCKSCWHRYGKAYTGAVKNAYEQGGAHGYFADKRIQQPLQFYTPMQSHAFHPPTPRPTQAFSPSFGTQPPSGPSSRPDVYPEDQHSSVPPRYDVVSHTSSEKPLMQQDYPLYAPPPPPRPMPCYAPPPPGAAPLVDWYGYQPPPGAVAVMPGDPRIGGTLCYKCGGTGNANDLFSLFGLDDECNTCGGAGRIMR